MSFPRLCHSRARGNPPHGYRLKAGMTSRQPPPLSFTRLCHSRGPVIPAARESTAWIPAQGRYDIQATAASAVPRLRHSRVFVIPAALSFPPRGNPPHGYRLKAGMTSRQPPPLSFRLVIPRPCHSPALSFPRRGNPPHGYRLKAGMTSRQPPPLSFPRLCRSRGFVIPAHAGIHRMDTGSRPV